MIHFIEKKNLNMHDKINIYLQWVGLEIWMVKSPPPSCSFCYNRVSD